MDANYFMIGLAILLAFLLGWQLSKLLRRESAQSANKSIKSEYFRGLNFLVNEEPDKAIEVFIQALEVDDETVELHLALGGLFRRRGQVDRATRVHQNIIARPNLNDEQRSLAVLELALDYHKAGWLDRAESLFKELLDKNAYRNKAIEGLCRIYEQEKDWQKAIDILHRLKSPQRLEVSTKISHYYCELAELALTEGNFQDARRFIDNSQKEAPTVARTAILKGDLFFAQDKDSKAREQWLSVAASNPRLAEFTLDKMIASFERCDDQEELKSYLLEFSTVPKDARIFERWKDTLFHLFGPNHALKYILSRVEHSSIGSSLALFLDKQLSLKSVDELDMSDFLAQMLERAGSQISDYRCLGCGFETKAMYWFCPNCSEWESFR